jgi:uncharacterized membrane protein YdbT with pleckstrin-like domain
MPWSASETIKSTLGDAADDLNPNETLLHRNQFHWIRMSWPVFFAVLFFLPGVFALGGLPARGGSPGGTVVLGTIGLFFVAVAAAIFFIAHLSWKSREIILTNSRLMLTSGIIRTEITSIRLDRIKTTTVGLSLLGKALGYGTVILCDADGTVRCINKISQPEELNRLLQHHPAADSVPPCA